MELPESARGSNGDAAETINIVLIRIAYIINFSVSLAGIPNKFRSNFSPSSAFFHIQTDRGAHTAPAHTAHTSIHLF